MTALAIREPSDGEPAAAVSDFAARAIDALKVHGAGDVEVHALDGVSVGDPWADTLLRTNDARRCASAGTRSAGSGSSTSSIR